MKRSILSIMVAVLVLLVSTSMTTAAGFDQYGYNRTARIFVGTGTSWCMEKIGLTESECIAYMDPYGYDQLVMKWNEDWDRGNTENWSVPPYNAWINNEWNGKKPGGSGEVWHYKIVWVGPCGADGTELDNGGYCIWGQFATIMDHGVGADGHVWNAKANPAGYGAYYGLTFP